jgi:hypothetical protein
MPIEVCTRTADAPAPHSSRGASSCDDAPPSCGVFADDRGAALEKTSQESPRRLVEALQLVQVQNERGRPAVKCGSADPLEATQVGRAQGSIQGHTQTSARQTSRKSRHPTFSSLRVREAFVQERCPSWRRVIAAASAAVHDRW